MELLNLLAGINIPLFGQTFDVSLNWIGKLISWLIKGVGTVGVGIIIFSLCLKIIVLPFDVYQRISMRKQNQKMKDQKERMEKLQKQYANDKQMYNQKLMEMYKESGISMFSSCLPMILSMVIFIVAINAFNAYAQFSTIDNYNRMVGAYKQAIIEYTPNLEDDNNITVNGTTITVKDNGNEPEAYLYYEITATDDISAMDKEQIRAYVKNILDEGKLTNCYVDKSKISDAKLAEITSNYSDLEEDQAIRKYFINIGQEAVLKYYNSENGVEKNTKFLWIKNIWMTDASYKHPVCDYATFEMEAKREEFNVNGDNKTLTQINESGVTNVYKSTTYDEITAKLTVQKEQANGYFILIALSIGTILLQQFVTMRSQKEQQQFSTVDGQGASQQKMMLVMMTGMFAIFSFMYSSAFSIYMITSNIFSLLSTLIINKFVDSKLEKESNTITTTKMDNRTLSRIEAAKQAGKESAQSSKEKKNKDDKTE
ncbi:MAG: membrane protein insertase YidC [Clostridiales bacterium]|nr:membrane protein insertase YidC [Clostridiales bacterium]